MAVAPSWFGSFELLRVPQSGVGRSEYLRRLWAAYRRGRASPRFLDFWFEDHWETPVATQKNDGACLLE